MRHLRTFALLGIALFIVTGCQATAGSKSSGHGVISSGLNPTVATAKFSYTFDCGKDTSCATPKANGKYRDGGSLFPAFPDGVRMKLVSMATRPLATPSTGSTRDNCATATVNYASADKKHPGAGQAEVSVCDLGHGRNGSPPDTFGIAVISGPYSGYANGPKPLNCGKITVINGPKSGDNDEQDGASGCGDDPDD